MTKPELAIFTNLCMVYDDCGNILVIDRKKEDWPGITFPGGKVEHGESFTESLIREVYKKTGLAIENPTLCGIKQFQTDEDVRYVVLFYKTNKFSGLLSSSAEGEVFWIFRETLANYRLSVDFGEMIRIFEAEDLSEFYYYRDNDAWKYQIL